MVALAENSTLPARRAAGLRLLGGFQLEVAGAPVNVPLNGQRLLAYLGLRGALPRANVAGTLWPEAGERNAFGSLRTTIWRIHGCGVDLIEAAGDRVGVAPSVTVDAHVFAEAAQEVLRTPDFTDTARLPLHGGETDLLPGWYDDWVIFERERLRQLQLHAMEAVAARLAEQRCYAAGLDTALAAIRLEPLRESAHRVVIGIHLAEGNVGEAVRHYRFVSALLRDELGVAPSPHLAGMLPAAALRDR